MGDVSWYYAKGGQRLGPFDLVQLGQMVSAGLITPVDAVTREGGTEWVDAATVPELFPSPPAARPGSPLVGCEKCRARISDVAERCPQCGHPQAPLVAKEQREELSPCPHCGAHNRVRNRLYFLFSDCRGCGRPVAEVYPRQRFEAQVDQLYQGYVCTRDEFHWGVIATGVVCGALIAGLTSWMVAPALFWGAASLGGLIGYGAALPLFSILYHRLFISGRRLLPPPDEDRTASRQDWGTAESRHDWEERREERERAGSGNSSAFPWAKLLGWAGGVVAVVVVVGFVVVDDQAKAAKRLFDQEAAVGAAMANGITAGKSEGAFSHDVSLTNQSKSTFGTCELTVTVYFDTGKQPPVGRFWATWGPGERKTVNLPSGGRIERVDLSGTMVNADTRQNGRLEATFEWKPKPPQPRPGG